MTKTIVFFGAFSLALVGAVSATPPGGDRQAAVHEMGAHVMPFDLERTQHVFEMTVRGGIQDVVTRDPNDATQISLIRMHLQHEAERFSAGQYSDPIALHGADMPGLSELQAGAAEIRVTFHPLPDGARITFETDDPTLLTALHRWFGAQLSDHAGDATYR